MILLGYLLAAILDPGTFVIILILGFIRFNKKLMFIYAIIVALLAEGFYNFIRPSGFQIDSLFLSLLGTFIQSFVAYFVIKFFKSRKKN